MKLKSLLSSCLLAVLLTAAAQDLKFVAPLLSFSEHPAIDGVISREEWRNSLRLGGFLRPSPNPVLVANGEGFVHFACDGSNIYFAFHVPAKNFDPGGGLKSDAKERDGAVYDDDSVELVMIPDTAKGKLMYHFIFNPNGTIFDRKRDAGGTWHLEWNCPGILVGSKVTSGWWDLETKIPLSSLSLPRSRMRLNACRSFAGGGPSGIAASMSYFDPTAMFDLEWRCGAPAIQMTSIGSPLEGKWLPEIMIAKAPGKKKFFADIEIREYKHGDRNGKSVRQEGKTLEAGCGLNCRYVTRSREPHSLEINVRDGDTGESVFQRKFYACRGIKTDGIPPTGEFDLGDSGTGVVFYYPSKNWVRVNVIPASEMKITEVKLKVGGKETAFTRQDGGFTALAYTPAEEGAHPMDVTLTFADGKFKTFPAAFTLNKKKFLWENNTLGKDLIVIPPFKPVEANGDTLKVILREYALNASGLPRSVRALDREILAGEAYYELTADGKTVRFTGNKPSIKVIDNGCAAEILAEASAPNGVKIHSRGRFEYDGFLWNEVNLTGVSGKTVERLTLTIPFKGNEAPLYHIAAVDTIRHNPAGILPQGEGVIWSGDKLQRNTHFLDPMHAFQVVPYLWLGAERRGLCWFVNNTAGMKLDAKKPSVRIVRKKDVVNVEIDIINRPANLREGHRFAFGMEATPVKLPERQLLRHFQSGFPEHPKNMIARMEIYENPVGYFNRWARHPWKNDWALFEKGYRLANTGKGWKAFRRAATEWHWKYDADLEAYGKTQPDVDGMPYVDWFKGYTNNVINVFMGITEPVYPFKYSDPTLIWDHDETADYFKSEWISRRSTYSASFRTFLVPSCLDFILYCTHEELKRGLKGVYFDDMFPMVCRNADTSARTDDEGMVHGNLGILEMRELVKRTAVMQYKMGIFPRLIQVHMTNCLLIPSFAFATSQLSWEDHFGEDEFQKRYSIDYIRAESIGTQLGAEGVALDGIRRRNTPPGKWDRRYAELTRTQMALLLPAGIRIWRRLSPQGVHKQTLFKIWDVLGEFRIWDGECRFVAFYDNDGAVAAPEKVLTGTYRRPDKVLALFGNLDGRRKTFTLKADLKKLGLPTDCRFTNAETGKELPGGQVTLNSYDLAMVLITAKQPVAAQPVKQ